MKYIAFSFLSFVILSCTEKKNVVRIPDAPVSAETIQKNIQGKHFISTDIALASAFQMQPEQSYEWMEDMKDTTAFFKNYLSERKKFALFFQNDSTAIIFDDNKTINGIYKIDNEKKEEEKDGFKLRISYIDSSVSFPGATEPMTMTFTYYIAGADEHSVFLELPREYNNRKVFTLLKAK